MNAAYASHQSLTAKRAEALYRRGSGPALASDTAAVGHHRTQLLATLADLGALVDRGVALGPFLEIGAGRAYRSAALMQHWPTAGVACDISLGWLTDAPTLASVFGLKHPPDRVCCDAADLPFIDGTFGFAFAYRTLHHFPDPSPVVAEAHRVLGGGGHFYFNHEPVDSALRRGLRGGRTLAEPPNRAQRMAARLGVDKVFWDDGGPERAAGILETRFELDRWHAALSVFEDAHAVINRRLRMHIDMLRPGSTGHLAGVVGGNIEALCRKAGAAQSPANWRDRLMCLDCGASPLERLNGDGAVRCQGCGRTYPCVDDVLVMLPLDLQDALYPDLV